MSETVITCARASKPFHSATTFSDLLRGRLFGPRVQALAEVSFSFRLTGRQNLRFFAALYGRDRARAEERARRDGSLTHY